MPKKLKTNTDLVRDLMEFSPHGAVAQMIIMEAIQRYARQCAEADPAKFDNPMINGKTWVACARDIVKRCDAFYNRHSVGA